MDVGGFNRKSVDERASGPGWARAYEVERMAALPHLLHKDQWELKKLLVNNLPYISIVIYIHSLELEFETNSLKNSYEMISGS